MNFEQFSFTGTSFDILDFRAEFEFITEASLGFYLGQQRDSTLMGQGFSGFRIFGWLDVHYACDGHIKVRMRVCLPKRYYRDIAL